jgi:hypothetical protein
MAKHEILNILRIFCVNENKGIRMTQDLLHHLLLENELGRQVQLAASFKYVRV